MTELKSGELLPSIYVQGNKEFFYMLRLTHIESAETKTFPTISQLLDRYYYGKAERDRVKQQGNDLERFIINERKKMRIK